MDFFAFLSCVAITNMGNLTVNWTLLCLGRIPTIYRVQYVVVLYIVLKFCVLKTQKLIDYNTIQIPKTKINLLSCQKYWILNDFVIIHVNI